MANERSGSPSGNPRKKPTNPEHVAADGWPTWMGDADPSLAPAPVKPRAAKPVAPARQAVAASRSAPAPEAPPPPAPAPERATPRRWLRTLICVVALLLALVAGDMAARSRPEGALRFQRDVTDLAQRLPASVPLVPIAAATALFLFAGLVWQAGRAHRPLFLPLAVLLCAASAGIGAFRAGHGVDLERSASKLQKEIREWRTSASKELETLHRKLREQTERAEAAQAERDKMAGSLQTSSIAQQAALKEKDEALSALRKEIEELRKKLEEKD
jgi:hypothetical protein